MIPCTYITNHSRTTPFPANGALASSLSVLHIQTVSCNEITGTRGHLSVDARLDWEDWAD